MNRKFKIDIINIQLLKNVALLNNFLIFIVIKQVLIIFFGLDSFEK